jgi:hypothetical protein
LADDCLHFDLCNKAEANYKKSERGVKVKRVFIQERNKKFSPGEKKILREHISGDYPNVEGRVVFAADLHYLDDYHIPSGFGFAILGDSVIVHWGLDRRKAEAGRILEDPWFVDIHRDIFIRLWTRVAKGKTDQEKAKIRKEILDEH